MYVFTFEIAFSANARGSLSSVPFPGFKTVDQSSGVNVSGGFRQSSGGGGGGGAVSYMPLTGSGSTTHIIEQPISQRPYSYEYPFTPPFPHQSQLTHGWFTTLKQIKISL